MIQQRMIVCESISCFIRQSSVSDIINIRYTRHDETQQTFSNASLQSFRLLILMRFFLSLSYACRQWHSRRVFSSSFGFFFLLFSLPVRERMHYWWWNRKRGKKRIVSECLHPMGDKHQWRTTEELSLLHREREKKNREDDDDEA